MSAGRHATINVHDLTRRHRQRRHRRRRPRRPVLRAEAGAAAGHGDFGRAARPGRLDGVGARRHRRRGHRGRQRGGACGRYGRRRRGPGRRSDRARDWRAKPAARIHDLLQYGVPFDRDLEGRLAVGREAAHSARRIVHVRGDMAGQAIISALIEAVRATPSIRVIEGFAAEALSDRGRRGHRTSTAQGRRRRRQARDHRLARGGAGDRRHRPSLCRHHQSGGSQRIGACDRRARRRRHRRSGIRAVPPHRDHGRPRSGAAGDRSACAAKAPR